MERKKGGFFILGFFLVRRVVEMWYRGEIFLIFGFCLGNGNRGVIYIYDVVMKIIYDNVN